MLGNSGVGKTALVERITNSDFNDIHVPTVGAQFISINFNLDNNKITIELWDTAGQEVFRSLVGFYARDAKGVFLVADLTSKTTLEELDKWAEFIKDEANDAKVILWGNKTDLADKREIKEDSLQRFANQHHYVYMEGSAKTGENVEDGFTRMAELVHSCHHQHPQQQKLDIKTIEKPQKKGCC